MTAFVEAAGGSPRLLLLLILVAAGASALAFGFLPALLLRLSLRCYPPDHERREELAREFTEVAIRRRPAWAASTMILCLDEGLGARRARRVKRAQRVRPTERIRRILWALDGPSATVAPFALTVAMHYVIGLPLWVAFFPAALAAFFVGLRSVLIRRQRRQNPKTEKQ